MGFSRNYWSAVENERKVLSEESLLKVLELLEFEEDERQELLELRELAKQHGWWARYSGLLGAEMQRLYGLEDGAQSVRTYENLLVPGLLQIADYARALMSPNVTIRQVDVEQLVEIRLRRQERLGGASPLRLTAVISEAALRQEIGGPAVLKRQLEHLAKTIEENSNSLDLRVIPFTVTSCPLFGSSTIHVIDFASSRLPTAAWQETLTTHGIIDDPLQVRDIDIAYEETLRLALNAQESLRIIKDRIGELA
jgi:hypothetical protein